MRAYQIKRNSTNYSDYSNTDSATTFDIIPAAPSNLGSYASSTSIGLYWTDNSDNEDNFEIERSLNGVDFSLLTTTTFYFYTDFSVATNTTYYYRVRAVNTIGNSIYSSTTSSTIN